MAAANINRDTKIQQSFYRTTLDKKRYKFIFPKLTLHTPKQMDKAEIRNIPGMLNM